MGRLFDAVAALCGIRHVVTYEGQAAVELEAAADPDERGVYPMPGFDARETVRRGVVADLARGGRRSAWSPRASTTRSPRGPPTCAAAVAAARGLDTVVLSGGVFQNRRLLETHVGAARRGRGLRVLTPVLLPPNDGGISYGQAAVAAARDVRA